MISWLILVLSLPGRSATPRMRVWRALKAHGAGVLRDGVYLLPQSAEANQAFDGQVETINAAGGSAHVIQFPARNEDQESSFLSLFDRSADYSQWLRRVAELGNKLSQLDEVAGRREESQLRRSFESIIATDFFPGEARAAAEHALEEIARLVNNQFSPDEPTSLPGKVHRITNTAYRDRRWATRRSLWIDRVACAWLIKRFIDSQAEFLWLERPRDCPSDAVGFDFDGAEFSHIEERVTFEVLIASFGLDTDGALTRLGSLVHYLDVGGIPIAEAPGVLALLGAARRRCNNDDDFLTAAATLFDDLYTAYSPSEGRTDAN